MKYDLEERLLEFASRIVKMCEAMPTSVAGRHVSGQVLRSGTAPMAHHGEAQAAESRKDFIHKLRLGLKELKETYRWLRLIHRVPLVSSSHLVEPLIKECQELTLIFASSINTALSKDSRLREESATYQISLPPTVSDDEE